MRRANEPLGVINNPLVKNLYCESQGNSKPAPPGDKKFIITDVQEFIVTNDGKYLVT